MTGRATALHAALWDLVEETDTHSSTLPEAARGITTEQLAVMDAAAEAAAGEDARETNHEEAIDGSLILCLESSFGGAGARASLDVTEERRLLRLLLDRAVKRRKEGGA